MIVIDKSLLEPDELAAYNAIIAKAAVPAPEVDEDEEVEFDTKRKKAPVVAEVPDEPEEEVETAKSNPESPEAPVEKGEPTTMPDFEALMKSSNDRIAKLEKELEMKAFREIAKGYAPLGEKEDELSETLYSLSKSNPEGYASYIDLLDRSLQLVEKSGVFAEIGKNTQGTSGSAVDKVEAAADAIMKADPTMPRYEAVAKAWLDHPELVDEYEAEYRK